MFFGIIVVLFGSKEVSGSIPSLSSSSRVAPGRWKRPVAAIQTVFGISTFSEIAIFQKYTFSIFDFIRREQSRMVNPNIIRQRARSELSFGKIFKSIIDLVTSHFRVFPKQHFEIITNFRPICIIRIICIIQGDFLEIVVSSTWAFMQLEGPNDLDFSHTRRNVSH